MTERQKRFIPLYVKLGNASEAARQAGYKEKNADNVSCRLMKKPEISAAIKELMDKTYNISFEEYTKRTVQLHNEETNKSVKARYWELLGRVKQYDRSEVVTINTNVYQKLINDVLNKSDQEQLKDVSYNGQLCKPVNTTTCNSDKDLQQITTSINNTLNTQNNDTLTIQKVVDNVVNKETDMVEGIDPPAHPLI